LCGREAGFRLGQLARHSRSLGADFVYRDLLRPFLVFDHQQPLTRPVKLGFKRHHPLVGSGQSFVEPAVLLAQRLAFARWLTRFGRRVKAFSSQWLDSRQTPLPATDTVVRLWVRSAG
jgi:hypothetical protein